MFQANSESADQAESQSANKSSNNSTSNSRGLTNSEIDNLYSILQKKLDLEKPQFIRMFKEILFDKDFPGEEIEKIIKVFYTEFYKIFSKNENQIFQDNQECKQLIMTNGYTGFLHVFDGNQALKKFDKFKEFPIEWMTISNTTVKIKFIWVKCKIQLTAKSCLYASYSIFTPQSLTKTESAIEVFANSRAFFYNCHFHNAERVAVIARNYSTVAFVNCVFINNKISCFVMDDSLAQFIDCIFTNDENISIFVTKDSKAEMCGCLFYNTRGKAIFAKDSSKVYVTNTKFIKCKKGAATIAEGSSLFLDDVEKITNYDKIIRLLTENDIINNSHEEIVDQKDLIKKENQDDSIKAISSDDQKFNVEIISPENTSVRAINKSKIKARSVFIDDTQGNAVNIENSNGYFYRCIIKRTVHPTIAVIGRKANPIFYECQMLENEKTFGAICKNCCRPFFIGCTCSDYITNCISVSDFSQPHFQDCIFKINTSAEKQLEQQIEELLKATSNNEIIKELSEQGEQSKNKHDINAFSGSKVTFSGLIKIIADDDPNSNHEVDIHLASTAKLEEITYDQLKKEERKNAQKDDDDDDDEGQARVTSWRSPTYTVPDDISHMGDPAEINDNDDDKNNNATTPTTSNNNNRTNGNNNNNQTVNNNQATNNNQTTFINFSAINNNAMNRNFTSPSTNNNYSFPKHTQIPRTDSFHPNDNSDSENTHIPRTDSVCPNDYSNMKHSPISRTDTTCNTGFSHLSHSLISRTDSSHNTTTTMNNESITTTTGDDKNNNNDNNNNDNNNNNNDNDNNNNDNDNNNNDNDNNNNGNDENGQNVGNSVKYEKLKYISINEIINKFDSSTEGIKYCCSGCGKEFEINDNEGEIQMITPCGHGLCLDCQDKHKFCPICYSKVKESKKVFLTETCTICLDKPSNTLSLPCGHLCMCYECASKCAENNFNCPMCNEPLNSYKYFFNDYTNDPNKNQNDQIKKII